MIFAFLYGDKPLSYFIYTLFTLVAVVIGLTLHEVAHGLVAKWNGDYTAKYAGRLTLNPVKHFDLVGFLMMMMVGFGYAKPVPVNPSNYRHYRKGLITVAIAGIVMNVIVAFITTLFGFLFFFEHRDGIRSDVLYRRAVPNYRARQSLAGVFQSFADISARRVQAGGIAHAPRQ